MWRIHKKGQLLSSHDLDLEGGVVSGRVDLVDSKMLGRQRRVHEPEIRARVGLASVASWVRDAFAEQEEVGEKVDAGGWSKDLLLPRVGGWDEGNLDIPRLPY